MAGRQLSRRGCGTQGLDLEALKLGLVDRRWISFSYQIVYSNVEYFVAKINANYWLLEVALQNFHYFGYFTYWVLAIEY